MSSAQQFIRYATVGLVSNLLLFVLYIFATKFGAGHKSAMSVLYVLGVLWTFAFNRSWSFGHHGSASPAALRYLTIYLVGYGINWTVLYVLVDRLGWPHEWVQGVMILILAMALFLLQKFWVFCEEAS